MKKSILLLNGLLTLLIVCTISSCSKEDSPKEADIVLGMNTNTWDYFSYKTLTTVPTGSTTFFSTNDTLVGLGQAARLGGRFQTKKQHDITGKVLYYKWKVSSGGQFTAIVPQLKYDPTTTDGLPPVQNVDLMSHSTLNSFNGSILVSENTWYYTRIAAQSETNNFVCTTATGNYSSKGGSVVATVNTTVYTKCGFLAIRMGDCFAGINAKFMLAECKISSN
ncbi:MAG: hypothetical protein WBP58_08465 [Chitinophagaceae bacterium]